MGWHFMLNLYRDGDEPPACTIENNSSHDPAVKAERFSHVDDYKIGDTYRMPVHRAFIVGKIEAQSIPFLAFKAREPTFLTVLAWVLQLWKCPFLLHSPVVGQGLSQIAELLFRCAFCDLVAPGELFAFDGVILCLEVFHLRPFSLGPVLFPASKRPVIGMACNPAGFAKVDFLFWCWIEPNHVRTIHDPLLPTLCAEPHLSALSCTISVHGAGLRTP